MSWLEITVPTPQGDLNTVSSALTARGLTAEVTQIGVSRTKTVGKLHLLMANNPVFLISAGAAEAAL